MQTRKRLSEQTADFMNRNSRFLIIAVVIITALLIIPILTMAPDQTASDHPGGEVYELQDIYDSKMPRRIHVAFFIAESRNDRDFLTQAPLWELYQNTEALRSADIEGKLHPPELPVQSYLYKGFDADREQSVTGIFTLADAVQPVLKSVFGVGLQDATDDQVKIAIHLLFNDPKTASIGDLVYQKGVRETQQVLGQQIHYWTAPALGIFVAGDNEKLGGGVNHIGTTSDPVTTGKEHFNRKVQAILRGDEITYQMWGIAIDASIESAEEVATAVPFIIATFMMVLIVVGVCLRSLRITILTGVGLAAMLVWLKGLSNLVGLDSSTTLDFIVPIAMISLGADFGIHALNRYKEEHRVTPDPRIALKAGMTGVLSALILAMVTDAIAFLSNVSANIDTVIGFGIGAGIAIFAAFVIMGLALPMALMELDYRRYLHGTQDVTPSEPKPERLDHIKRFSLANIVITLAKWRLVVLPIALTITIISTFYAFQLESTFDAKDFYKSDSDFVVGLDKLDLYVGDTGGESAIVLIQGDLADPTALRAIQDFTERIEGNEHVAKNEGSVQLQARSVFHLLHRVITSNHTKSLITESSGITLFEEGEFNQFRNGSSTYLWPNSKEELDAIYDHIAINGIHADVDTKIYDSLEIRETLFHDPDGIEEDITAIVIGIPGTREQRKVVMSRESLGREIVKLQEEPAISRAGLTGSPYTRQESLDATTEGLQRALVIAVVACLAAVIISMRSVAFGLVTILPVGLVVSWLYAFMYVFGFSLNFVTATIAAVSIGIGIDFAVHMTQRYREELGKLGSDKDPAQALYRAAQGTGVALLASAATSIIGFAIMGFAPMPIFSTYGILTAIMIFLSATASLLILPSLLILVTKDHFPS